MADAARHILMGFASRIKKRFAMETASTFTIRSLYISAFNELVKIYGMEKTIEALFRWGFEMGHEYMLELRRDIEKLKPRIDAPPVAKIAWYTFMGHDLSGVEGKWVDIDGRKVFLLRFWDNDCPLCRGLEVGRENRVCVYNAGAYEGAYQTVLYLKNIDAFAMAREIRCRAAGAPSCEFYVVDIPSEYVEEVAPKVEEIIPGFYSQISYDFSRKLREIIV